MMTFPTVNMMQTLDEVTPADETLVGGKAFNCARLKQAGFPVPEGLVVPGDATDAEIRALVEHPWLRAISDGTLFAVRSSGLREDSTGHSFAGIHETQLNVGREQLVEAVRVCRRSACSDQARAYREARHLVLDESHIGVLVQRMVLAGTSGVAFTVNPITGADELVINAVRGLGEALVSGRVDPDEFRVAKRDATVLSARRGSTGADDSQPSALSASQLVTLAALLTRVEAHYGTPQDVEWCHDGRQFWIVQSRPVTTAVARSGSQTSPASPESPVPNSDPEWTRANLAEVLPDQLSPQALDVYLNLLNAAERKFLGRFMAPESDLGPMVKSFHGRLYFNVSQFRHVTTIAGAAFADTLRSLGHADQIQPEDEIPTRAPIGDVLRALPDFVRLVFYGLRAEHILGRHETTTEQSLARLAATDPRTSSDRDIWATLQRWIESMPDTLAAVLVMSSMQPREDVVRKACRAVGFSYERLVYPQLAAGERSVSTQQAIDLVALAEVARHDPAATRYLLANDGTFTDVRTALAGTMFLDGFERFLERYGHRGRYESDWALPRLHEDPAPVLFALRGQLQGTSQDVKALAERQAADAAAAWREFEARLTAWQTWMLLPRMRSTIRRLKKQYGWRERVRSDASRVLSRIRARHLVLADRFVPTTGMGTGVS